MVTQPANHTPRSSHNAKIVAKFAITSIDVEDKGNGYVEFDSKISGVRNDDNAVLLMDVEEIERPKVGFLWKRKQVPLYRARKVGGTEFVRAVQNEVDRTPHLKGVLLYIHGFNMEPHDVMKEVTKYHSNVESNARTPQSLCIPVIWPSEGSLLNYLRDRFTAVPGSSKGLITLVNTFQALETSERRPDIPWALLSHSMGNFLLRKIGELNQGKRPLFSQIFMVASDVSQDVFERDAKCSGDTSLHPGEAICKLLRPGGKIHVLWTRRDVALYFRRWMNWFVRALGREGVRREKLKAEFRGENEEEDLVVGVQCDKHSRVDMLAHSYHFAPGVVEYYNAVLYGKNGM